jgi:hypothetical protein
MKSITTLNIILHLLGLDEKSKKTFRIYLIYVSNVLFIDSQIYTLDSGI